MPAPTTHQSKPPPAHDLLVRVEIQREGEFPWVALVFRPVAGQSGTNAFGLPLYVGNWPVYTLLLDSRNPLALMNLDVLMQGVATRIVAGASLDAGIADEAYALLAHCVAIGNVAGIAESLGVEVRGASPFPATAA